MTKDNCGWPTAEGTACEHPATEDSGRCWQHDENAKTGGRPSKFDDERAREAVQAARECKSLRGCGRAAGVMKNTIKNWLRQNPEFQTEDGEWKNFLPAFLRARAEAESLLTRGGLTRPDDLDGAHARFLLKTSFGYQDVDRIEFSETDDDASDEVITDILKDL